jgi:hypothetical protein
MASFSHRMIVGALLLGAAAAHGDDRERRAELIVARSADSFWLDPRTKLNTGEALPTRRLCAFPQRARWTGRGSTDDAANFQCIAPEKHP